VAAKSAEEAADGGQPGEEGTERTLRTRKVEEGSARGRPETEEQSADTLLVKHFESGESWRRTAEGLAVVVELPSDGDQHVRERKGRRQM
jgi:hypothetical protein